MRSTRLPAIVAMLRARGPPSCCSSRQGKHRWATRVGDVSARQEGWTLLLARIVMVVPRSADAGLSVVASSSSSPRTSALCNGPLAAVVDDVVEDVRVLRPLCVESKKVGRFSRDESGTPAAETAASYGHDAARCRTDGNGCWLQSRTLLKSVDHGGAYGDACWHVVLGNMRFPPLLPTHPHFGNP